MIKGVMQSCKFAELSYSSVAQVSSAFSEGLPDQKFFTSSAQLRNFFQNLQLWVPASQLTRQTGHLSLACQKIIILSKTLLFLFSSEN
jgi:hypothetical protein